jgi:hypothetical protein
MYAMGGFMYAMGDFRHEERVRLYDKIAPDLSKRDRDSLEGAGLTPRQIDDTVAALRVRMPNGFSRQDVLDTVHSPD